MCNNPLYVLHINDSRKESQKFDAILSDVCCSGFLIARTNTMTCLENGEWELETSQMKNEGGLLKCQYGYCEVIGTSLNIQENLIRVMLH